VKIWSLIKSASDALIVDAKSDLNLYKQSTYLGQGSCCGTTCSSKESKANFSEIDFNEWVGKSPLPSLNQKWLGKNIDIRTGSFQIYAAKTGGSSI
jgi:hypothetical protein